MNGTGNGRNGHPLRMKKSFRTLNQVDVRPWRRSWLDPPAVRTVLRRGHRGCSGDAGGQQGKLVGNTEYGIRGEKAVQISSLFSPTKDQLEKIQRYQRAAKKAVNIVVASQGKHMFRGIYVLKFQYSRHAFLLKSFFLFTSPVPQICSNATKYDHK